MLSPGITWARQKNCKTAIVTCAVICFKTYAKII